MVQSLGPWGWTLGTEVLVMKNFVAAAWFLLVVVAGCSGGSGGENVGPDTGKDVVDALGDAVPDLRGQDTGGDREPADIPDVRTDPGDEGWWPDGWDVNPDAISDAPDAHHEILPFDLGAEDVAPPDVKVKDLQMSEDSVTCKVLYGAMLIAVDIPLNGVVVSAPTYTYQVVGEKLDGFYVQDPEGGAYGGIHVTFSTKDVPDLKPGMVLNLVGDHKEAFCFTSFSAKSLVVANDNGEAPKPALSTPAEIAADPEPYEGVLIKVENATVTNANPDEEEGLDHQEFEIDGVLRVGNDYGLKYMNPSTDARKVGDQFTYIVGVLKFSDGKYHLMPRFNADLLLVGDTPPVEEEPEIVEEVTQVEIGPDVVEQAEVIDLVEAVPDETEPEVVEELLPEDLPPDLPLDDVAPDVPDEPPSPVVITEIMYDTNKIPDDLGEWIELYNASEDAVDLNGWRIEAEDGEMHIIFWGGPLLVNPGEFIVLGNNDKESTNGGVEVDYQYPQPDFALTNTADSVILKDLYGAPVDAVHYDETKGFPAAKGASLELIHPFLDNEDPASWKKATAPYGDGSNLGTPGVAGW